MNCFRYLLNDVKPLNLKYKGFIDTMTPEFREIMDNAIEKAISDMEKRREAKEKELDEEHKAWEKAFDEERKAWEKTSDEEREAMKKDFHAQIQDLSRRIHADFRPLFEECRNIRKGVLDGYMADVAREQEDTVVGTARDGETETAQDRTPTESGKRNVSAETASQPVSRKRPRNM